MSKLLTALCALLLSAAPLCAQTRKTPERNANFETLKMLDIFNHAYKTLELYYVDTIQAEKVVGGALEHMLSRLDPYTEYYKEEDSEQLRTITTGKYAGIGSPIRFVTQSDRCAFENPYTDKPAYLAGIRSGDEILSIDGQEIAPCGKTDRQQYISDITSKLRGTAGTTLKIEVSRPGTKGRLHFEIHRETIKLPSLSYAALREGQVGYLSLSRYIAGSTDEIVSALEALRQQGARSLILDLRGNGGGLMEEAVKIVNLFVPKDRVVVETRGKDPRNNETRRTERNPLEPELPLVILTDYGTASAAEITAGALQDYDRALVVGRRSYGKGLVQQPFGLPHEAQMKLTVAKYYIPSGRCVQALDYTHRNADGDATHLPDSLCKTYYTTAGRPVKDGGGITPDVLVPLDTLPNFLLTLTRSDELFAYTVRYGQTHKSIAPAADFALSPSEWEAFKQELLQSGFTYGQQSLTLLKNLREWARFEGYEQSTKAEFDALEAKLHHRLAEDLEHFAPLVKQAVEREIVMQYYGNAGLEAYNLRSDKVYAAALSLLSDPARYQSLLRPAAQTPQQ